MPNPTDPLSVEGLAAAQVETLEDVRRERDQLARKLQYLLPELVKEEFFKCQSMEDLGYDEGVQKIKIIFTDERCFHYRRIPGTGMPESKMVIHGKITTIVSYRTACQFTVGFSYSPLKMKELLEAAYALHDPLGV